MWMTLIYMYGAVKVVLCHNLIVILHYAYHVIVNLSAASICLFCYMDWPNLFNFLTLPFMWMYVTNKYGAVKVVLFLYLNVVLQCQPC